MNLSQASLFPFRPNWDNPVQYKIEYATDIIVTRSGKEQRRALRTVPSETLTLGILTDNQDSNPIDYMYSNYNKFIPIPNYAHAIPITSKSGLILTLDYATKWLSVGSKVAVYNGYQLHETTLSATSGNLATLVADAPFTINSDCFLIPIIVGEPFSENEILHYSVSVSETSLDFNSVRGLEQKPQSSNPTIVLDGREVIPFTTNWKSEPTTTFQNTIQKNSNTNGIGYFRDNFGFASFVLSSSMLSSKPNFTWDLELFFRRNLGRQGEFFTPSNNKAFDIASKTLNTITVTGLNLFNVYANSKVHKAICVKAKDGSFYYNKIISITNVSGNSLITLQNNWLNSFAVSDLEYVSWLYLTRFAADSMTFTWTNFAVCDIDVKLQVLEYLTAE